MTEGDIVAVRHRADAETLHERLVVWVVGGVTVIAYTPDGDVHQLVLSTPPLSDIVGPVRPGTYTRQHLRDLARRRRGGARRRSPRSGTCSAVT